MFDHSVDAKTRRGESRDSRNENVNATTPESRFSSGANNTGEPRGWAQDWEEYVGSEVGEAYAAHFNA
jgi:hypothetical protein